MIAFGLVTSVALTIATGALFLAIYRLFAGPTIMDRVASLDALGNTLVVLIAIYAFSQHSLFLLDVAILLALISFIGTLALSKYIDKGEVF
ncbi:MAG: cation:proton antiporter [Methanosarcinales archaeon]|jgi:multicomponent Na+:H+ antiporter subunit F|nr:cation:proton antiporter [Methanosarcinales archaeon]